MRETSVRGSARAGRWRRLARGPWIPDLRFAPSGKGGMRETSGARVCTCRKVETARLRPLDPGSPLRSVRERGESPGKGRKSGKGERARERGRGSVRDGAGDAA